MDDEGPQTVRRMLSYLYILEYPDERLPDDSVGTVVADPALSPYLGHRKSGSETQLMVRLVRWGLRRELRVNAYMIRRDETMLWSTTVPS